MCARILINGNFLCRSLTGIERFAWEVCGRLDALLAAGDDVSLLVPANARTVPEYRAIRLVRSPAEIRGFPRWDMGTFARACRRLGATALSFSNTAPLGRTCGIAFLHDIYAKDCPQDFAAPRDRLVGMYDRMQQRNICRNARKVITVSEFSRGRIQRAYRVPDGRIAVIGNGWEHFKAVESDASVLGRFPRLADGGYFFTLGSLSRRKNLAWLARYAAEHPASVFAVSGKAIGAAEEGMLPPELEALRRLDNVVLTGYASDGEVKALMEHCKAFLFPSYYEGFGIPPLEALSVGAPVIVARAASLPEIYGAAAHYIDPRSPDTDLDRLLAEPVEAPRPVLERYTYGRAAEQLLRVLREADNCIN